MYIKKYLIQSIVEVAVMASFALFDSEEESESYESDTGFGFFVDFTGDLDASEESHDEQEESKPMKATELQTGDKTVDFEADTVVWTFEKSFSVAEMRGRMKTDSSYDGSFTFCDGSGCDDEEDDDEDSNTFRLEREEYNDSDFDNENQVPGQHDMVIDGKIEIQSSYPGTVWLEFPTVNASPGKKHGTKGYVSMKMYASEADKKMHTKHMIHNVPNESQLAFFNTYQGQTPDNMKALRLIVEGYDGYHVRAENPQCALMYFYHEAVNKGLLSKRSLSVNKETKTVYLTKEEVDMCLPIAEKRMRTNLLFGDVTGNFTFRIQSGEGRNKKGWCGMGTLPMPYRNNATKQKMFESDTFFVRGRVTILYKKINSDDLQFKKK